MHPVSTGDAFVMNSLFNADGVISLSLRHPNVFVMDGGILSTDTRAAKGAFDNRRFVFNNGATKR